MTHLRISLALVLLALCWPGRSLGDEPLRVGIMLPQSGDLAPFGQKALAGVQLALGELGPDAVRVFIEDVGSAAGPDVASAATKLVEVDKAQLVLGLFYLDQTLVAAPITERAGVPLFSLTLCSPELKRFKRVACGYPNSNEQMAMLPRVFAALRSKRLALILDGTQYAAEAGAVVVKQVESAQVALTAREEYTGNGRDFRSLLTKVLARAPDTVFAISTDPGQSFALFSQLAQLGFKGNRIGYLDIDQKYLDEFGGGIEGILLPGFISTRFSPRFTALARKTTAGAPDMYAAQAYDVARTALEGALAHRGDADLFGRILAYRTAEPAITDFHFRPDGTVSFPVGVLTVRNRAFVDWDAPSHEAAHG